jgi:hypothetical protein
MTAKLLAYSGRTDTDGGDFVDKNGQKLIFEFKSCDEDAEVLASQAMQLNIKIGIDMKPLRWTGPMSTIVDNEGTFQAGFLGLSRDEPFLLVNHFCGRNPNNNVILEEYKTLGDKTNGTWTMTSAPNFAIRPRLCCTIMPPSRLPFRHSGTGGHSDRRLLRQRRTLTERPTKSEFCR